MSFRRFTKHREGLRRADQLMDRAEYCWLVHYSCESFYDRVDGRTPRVTSIAVRNLKSGTTESFSVHKYAELEGVPANQIGTGDNYDRFERMMLDGFYAFVASHGDATWVHWNMRDNNYGFAAIAHRHQVLGGQPLAVPDERRVDLARLLVDIYSRGYAAHPRLRSVVALNKIADRDMLAGDEEAAAWAAAEYVKLHQSTLRKVDIFANILERVHERRLRTTARWSEVHGISFRGTMEWLRDHPVVTLLGLVGTVAGVLAIVL